MPDQAPASQERQARVRRRAIACVLGSSGAFALAAALVKYASPGLPVAEVVLFRSLCSVLILLPMARAHGGWAALHTKRPGAHLLRLMAGFSGMYASFYGYANLPLATVTALGFSMPIFLAILSIPLLRERISPVRAGAVVVGLVGVLIVLRPWEAGHDAAHTGPALVVMAGVAAWALAMISIRRMGQSGERNVTIVLLFSIGSTVLAALLCIPVWVAPTPMQLLALVGVGVISTGAQLLMTEGYRSGEATMLAPFEYGAILYAVLLGWLIWGEVPGGWEFTGIAVLILSGLYVWWREGRS